MVKELQSCEAIEFLFVEGLSPRRNALDIA